MTLLIAINGAGDNWAVEPWKRRFATRLKGMPVMIEGIDTYRKEDVRFAAVWKPAVGLLSRLPNLKAIFNLGAGVDALLADRTIPNVPLVRVSDDDLTGRMTEYICLHVLAHHRGLPQLMDQQRRREWRARDQWSARSVRVGIMGMGVLGQDAAKALSALGFKVRGWSRSAKTMPGIETYAGTDGLGTFLGLTDILVVLLPLTDETRGILNAALFRRLARDGVIGAPIIINAGRGGLQVEADILSSLDAGVLGGATLDVFETEPLPTSSRLWTHPKVIVTPHNAADSDADAISDYVCRQIKNFEAGQPLDNAVDRAKGY